MSVQAVVAEGVTRLSNRVLIIGSILAVLGLVCILVPFQSGMAVSVLLGALLIAGGVIRTVFAFIGISWGSLLFRLVFGVLMILCGIWMVANPGVGVRALTMALAVYLLVDGILAIIFSFQLRPGAGGGWMLMNGILGALIAALIWYQWPMSGDFAFGVLMGIKLLVDGSTLIGLGMAGRSIRNTVEQL